MLVKVLNTPLKIQLFNIQFTGWKLRKIKLQKKLYFLKILGWKDKNPGNKLVNVTSWKLILHVIYFFKLDLNPLREKCLYSELFWSVFSRIRTEYGEVRMRENTDQNKSEYWHFLRNDLLTKFLTLWSKIY